MCPKLATESRQATQAEKPFAVRVRWGSTGTQNETYKRSRDGDDYEFDTEAELIAFLEGVEASNGWMDYAAWRLR